MLNLILEMSLTYRLVILLSAAALSLFGGFVITQMEVDVFPDLTAPTVSILTEAHNMDAEEVEQLVTYPIESGLNGSPMVRRIRSSSAAGISIVWVEFDWGTEIYKARQIVSEKIPMISEALPMDVGEPTLASVSSIMGEILLLSISSDSLPATELRALADWEIRPNLKSIPGVANVIVIGGEFKQFQVLASPLKMDHYGISLPELSLAVKNSSVNASGGFFNQYGNQYVIKGEGRTNAITDIEETPVKTVNGQPILVKDIAEVKIGAADKIGDGSLNGKPSVIMTIAKQPGVNTIRLTEKIESILKETEKALPASVDMNPHIFKQADFIEASVSNLQKTLLEGAFFVVLVLLLFLMNWRTTAISLIAIPLSLLVSFVVLKIMGYTINTMSLGGMAIAVGALVDDAIIDVENVFRRLRENIQRPKEERATTSQVVFEASKEIRSSIIIATLIIIVSFVPLFFLGGMEGRLLTPLGIAFVTSVLTSLIVAITVTPALCSYLLGREKLLVKRADGTRIEKIFQQGYQFALERVLRIPWVTILITVAGFGVTMYLAKDLGRSFLPTFNEGSLVISVVGPPSMSLDESNKIGVLVEETLLELEEIDLVSRRTGRSELDEHAQGVHASEVDAPFVLKSRSREEFLEEVRSRLGGIMGVNITIGMPIAHRIDHMLSGTRANIAIKVFGHDLEKLFEASSNIKSSIESIDGLVDVSVEQQMEVPQIKIKPNRQILARHGLSIGEFAKFIQVAFAGESVSQVFDEQRSFDLVVRYDVSGRGTVEKMMEALIDLPNGTKVALSEMAEITSESIPYSINRENVQRKVVVSANVEGRGLRTVVNDIKATINSEVELEDGMRIEYGGQFENEEEASRLLMWASIIAVLVIFVLLYLEFQDLKLAGIVLLNLPLAMIGGILIVYFSSGIVSIASTIGFISLFGIATRNGILLVSRYQVLKKEGLAKNETIMKGALDRLNPILMTALTTALALIPLALNAGEAGNEIQAPMAVVILGGLLTSTALNLFVIPCVYKVMNRA